MIHNKRPLILLVVLLLGTSLAAQQSIGIFSVFASESSAYDSGYDHGCDDAGISDPGDRYINEPGKGPSFHTSEFMSGYDAGFNSCSNRSGGGGGYYQPDQGPRLIQPPNQQMQKREIIPREIPQTPEIQQGPSSGGGGINWENLCNQYGTLVGIKDPCYEYADGTQLTEKGRTALVCLLGGGGISVLPGLDPATKATILELGRQYCP